MISEQDGEEGNGSFWSVLLYMKCISFSSVSLTHRTRSSGAYEMQVKRRFPHSANMEIYIEIDQIYGMGQCYLFWIEISTVGIILFSGMQRDRFISCRALKF